jgi:hypothetical protein
MKQYSFKTKHTFLHHDQYKVHQEAIILERMSNSPRILDIYAHCGTTVLVETMKSDIHQLIVPGRGYTSQKRLDMMPDVHPQNNLTNSEKLQISLSMAQSLADLHTFEGGIIVHGDTHIEQWLLAEDGSIKLNDFNYAKALQYDKRNQRYCFERTKHKGVYRAPEEFKGAPQDETTDVYSFGNNMYSLITGLWPFYNDREMRRERLRGEIVAGKRPYVDSRYKNRSYIESQLIDIMKSCWNGNRRNRPSMTTIVNHLLDVKQMALKIGELQASTIFNIPASA